MSTLDAPRAGRARDRRAVAATVVTAAVVTAWVLRGSFGRGQYLFRDFVAVPAPAAPGTLLPTSSDRLRAWPLDGVTWALSAVVPTGVQQAVLLLACLLLAGTGAGLLVARHGAAAAVAAAAVAVWNPYVVERLLLGQAPTLLGYAAMPWVLLAVRSGPPTPRRCALTVLAAAPAALTPWGGLVAALTAVAGALTRAGRTRRDVLVVAGCALVWCLPWVVPGLLAVGAGADPDGARAFALADDTGLGTWVSALLGGGVWAGAAQPLSRRDPLSVGTSILLLGAALVGAAGLWRSHGRRTGVTALAVLTVPASLLALTSGPALPLVAVAQSVPGVALLRDQHRLLAPTVLATAVLAGWAVGELRSRVGRVGAVLSGGLVVALAVAAAPDLPGRMGSAYVPRTYPADWSAVLAAVAGDRGAGSTGAVLSLPWQPLRATSWSGGEPFLDPLPRAVEGPVLHSTSLTVRRDGVLVVVDDAPNPDDAAWQEGTVSAASLRRHHVAHVVEWLGTPGALADRHTGWRLLLETEDFRVWDVSGAA